MNEVFRHDSFIELLRMRMLDVNSSVLTWTKRHSIRISYEIDGSQKKYVPDFLILRISGEMILEEVKGYENERKKQAKFEALKEYCKENGLLCSIVTYSDMDKLSKEFFGKNISMLRKEYKNGK
ncbi:MAG: hypothetical protein CMB80_31225 [Flammeovirgaceae bacterium]|nr:hypothetical protein [Flammeovirgaceae bacterium]